LAGCSSRSKLINRETYLCGRNLRGVLRRSQTTRRNRAFRGARVVPVLPRRDTTSRPRTKLPRGAPTRFRRLAPGREVRLSAYAYLRQLDMMLLGRVRSRPGCGRSYAAPTTPDQQVVGAGRAGPRAGRNKVVGAHTSMGQGGGGGGPWICVCQQRSALWADSQPASPSPKGHPSRSGLGPLFHAYANAAALVEFFFFCFVPRNRIFPSHGRRRFCSFKRQGYFSPTTEIPAPNWAVSSYQKRSLPERDRKSPAEPARCRTLLGATREAIRDSSFDPRGRPVSCPGGRDGRFSFHVSRTRRQPYLAASALGSLFHPERERNSYVSFMLRLEFFLSVPVLNLVAGQFGWPSRVV